LLEHLRLGFAHAHAAHGVAGKIERGERLRRFAPQVVERRALHDGEHVMPGGEETVVGGDLPALLRPAETARHRLRADRVFAGPRRALVDHHRDVGAEVGLDCHHLARAEEQARAVEMRLERHAVLADFAQLREAEDLKAAAVGQDRSVPPHEAVQAAQVADQFAARPQIEVVGVAEDDLGADLAQLGRRQRLDRGLGAHRHEDGRLHQAVQGAQPAAPRRRGCVGPEKLEVCGHRIPLIYRDA
jgi:hypothetical protein